MWAWESETIQDLLLGSIMIIRLRETSVSLPMKWGASVMWVLRQGS